MFPQCVSARLRLIPLPHLVASQPRTPLVCLCSSSAAGRERTASNAPQRYSEPSATAQPRNHPHRPGPISFVEASRSEGGEDLERGRRLSTGAAGAAKDEDVHSRQRQGQAHRPGGQGSRSPRKAGAAATTDQRTSQQVRATGGSWRRDESSTCASRPGDKTSPKGRREASPTQRRQLEGAKGASLGRGPSVNRVRQGTGAPGLPQASPRFKYTQSKPIPQTPDSKPIGFVPPLPGGAFPFHDFVHSYSESPKIPPLGFREPLFSPFGPEDMVARPWTGGAPLRRGGEKAYSSTTPGFHKYTTLGDISPTPPSSSLHSAAAQRGPPGQAPRGPGGAGSAPAPVKDVQGVPLSEEEVEEMVREMTKDGRQVNLGRDGLVHNMIKVIHDHWKRKPLCRVRCKGVPTVDMENVVSTIEERTGGKVVRRAGGVLFVFRGRHYNWRRQPQIPVMLWKPPSPIYPPLIQEAPEGLSKEEANALRIWGRRIKAACKLGKNGVYMDLVQRVRATLQEHPLCRVDCRELDKSDYKKIGAKLRDLVPCVLLSFERQQILVWRDHPDKRPKIVHTEGGLRLVGVGEDDEHLRGEDLTAKDTSVINGGGSSDLCLVAVEISSEEASVQEGNGVLQAIEADFKFV